MHSKAAFDNCAVASFDHFVVRSGESVAESSTGQVFDPEEAQLENRELNATASNDTGFNIFGMVTSD